MAPAERPETEVSISVFGLVIFSLASMNISYIDVLVGDQAAGRTFPNGHPVFSTHGLVSQQPMNGWNV